MSGSRKFLCSLLLMVVLAAAGLAAKTSEVTGRASGSTRTSRVCATTG